MQQQASVDEIIWADWHVGPACLAMVRLAGGRARSSDVTHAPPTSVIITLV